MTRGQLAGRLSDDFNGIPCYAIGGILEVPIGSLQDEVIHPFMCTTGRDFSGFLAMPPRSVIGSYPIEEADLGSLLTHPMWSMTAPGINGGSLLARKTRMPARSGHEILSFCGVLMFSGNALDEGVIYDLAPSQRVGFLGTFGGQSGFDVAARVPCPDLAQMRGNSFSALLKLPIWGFSEQKVGFRSTMRLDVIDECQELSDLLSGGETTATSKRAAFLDAGPAGDLAGTRSASARDKDYAEFRKAYDEIGGCRPRWDAVMTAADMERQEAFAREAVSRVLNRENSFSPAP